MQDRMGSSADFLWLLQLAHSNRVGRKMAQLDASRFIRSDDELLRIMFQAWIRARWPPGVLRAV